jgi:hypothetical protein
MKFGSDRGSAGDCVPPVFCTGATVSNLKLRLSLWDSDLFCRAMNPSRCRHTHAERSCVYRSLKVYHCVPM